MKKILRMPRIRRRRQVEEPIGIPSSLLGELAEMGVVEVSASLARPVNLDPAEAEKARWYARHGYLAFVNTSR
ncbi:MAG: hypothetical protein F7C33_01205 [Desulfurococcales archaeon]|nr:hypothetical protein [Desulfurococcales archaeon]